MCVVGARFAVVLDSVPLVLVLFAKGAGVFTGGVCRRYCSGVDCGSKAVSGE